MQEQLINALAREQKLLSVITAKPEPVKQEQVIAPQPVNRGAMPWHIKRQILEQEDRVKAAALKRQAEEAQTAKTYEKDPKNPEISQELSIKDLEKELAIGGE